MAGCQKFIAVLGCFVNYLPKGAFYFAKIAFPVDGWVDLINGVEEHAIDIGGKLLEDVP